VGVRGGGLPTKEGRVEEGKREGEQNHQAHVQELDTKVRRGALELSQESLSGGGGRGGDIG